jgi:membrane protein DedA with SNARE-associated domain
VIGVTNAQYFAFTFAAITAAAAFTVAITLIGVVGAEVQSSISANDIVGSSPRIMVEGDVVQI